MVPKSRGFHLSVEAGTIAQRDGVASMTATLSVPDRQRDRRMEDVKQELARAMEREWKFRTALREDRMRQLSVDMNSSEPTDRSRHEP